MDMDALLAELRKDEGFMADVAVWQNSPAVEARTAAWPSNLHPHVVRAFARKGIATPYTHQSQALQKVLAGESVVVVAGTAGGKSLIYQAAIADTLLRDPKSTALCLFPTKALSQDQLSALRTLLDDAELGVQEAIAGTARKTNSLVHTYDGDTPQSQRADIRANARVIVSNADMLHMGVLPHHTRWAAFLRRLKYVVLDELHTYRGVFGSHVANVIRRLRRLCRFYGSDPVFIMTSATIANPLEHASRLIEWPVTLIDDDGSPHGAQHVIVVNPPLLPDAMAAGLRRSALLVACDVTARLMKAGAQTICFARSRADTEVLLNYLRQRGLGDANSVRGYRSGYLPEERRAIEHGLRTGAVRGVTSTNALELGIDIGELDACVMCGYPGSIASFWQQAGRAGRRNNTSVAIFVSNANPLDQYLAAHSEYLFSQNPEHARIAPDNEGILAAHVACAVFELPFARGESLGNTPITEYLDLFVEAGDVHASGAGGLPIFGGQSGARTSKETATDTRYTWVGDSYPAERIGLRGIGDRITIQCDGAVIGETERASAAARVHPGAIYMHQADTYLITSLDWDAGVAHARRFDSDYYTRASTNSEVQVLRAFDNGQADPYVGSGELQVTSKAQRYKQIQFNTHHELGIGEIDLPEQTLLTVGYWLAVPADVAKMLSKEGVIKLPNDYGPNWQKQRNAARARDGFKCTVCGKPESAERQHDVHHKTPFRKFGYIAGENSYYLLANALENLITVCSDCHMKVETAERGDSALDGLAYLIGNIAPLLVMCDPSDLAVIADWNSPHTKLPTITLYELSPGGTGIAEDLRRRHELILEMCAQRARECVCERGCPACVGPIAEPRGDDPPVNLKRNTLRLIDMLRA